MALMLSGRPFSQIQPPLSPFSDIRGYGLMWNKDYLAKHQLDIPQDMEKPGSATVLSTYHYE